MLKRLKNGHLHMLLVFAFSILLTGCNFFDFQDDVVDDEIYEGNLDADDAVVNAYNLQGTTIEFYDCYFGENSDVLVLYFPDITLEEVYIKEVDIDNKIINVEIKHDTKEVVFNNGVYAVDVHGL